MIPASVPLARPLWIVEDEDLHARALQAAAKRVPRLRVGARAQSLAEARAYLGRASEEEPLLVVLDLGLPDGSGVDLVGSVRRRWPQARVFVVSSLTDERVVLGAIRAGAHGYFEKGASTAALARAMEDALDGLSPLSPRIARHLVAQYSAPGGQDDAVPLTSREQELLACLARGDSYAEAAACLGISLSTVQTHIRNLYGKLDVTSKLQAVNEARRRGLLGSLLE
jgi:DNA-binding NarL/FixJ family response regulator